MKKGQPSSFSFRRTVGCSKKLSAGKYCIMLFILLLSGTWLGAQITVTNSTFPVAGDVLKVAYASNPAVANST